MSNVERVIAIDLDDTLAYTNLTICKWHNEKYGTNLSVDDQHSYYYWKNPGWGTPKEAVAKVREFLLSPAANEIPPIEGAQRGTKRLKEAGYKLVVITARMQEIASDSVEWLEEHFPGIFDTVYFTSAFQSTQDEKESLVTEISGPPPHKHTISHPDDPRGQHLPAYSVPRKKSDVCLHVGAIVLIDDALENAFDVHENAKGIECLVYGQWKWNITLHTMDREEDQLSYEEAKARGIDVYKLEPTPLPSGIERTQTWTDVVQHINKLEHK
jgi:5' nucleotidase, deoxy (Pyrimidine), cytosolic type C protein (NT5C)